MGIKRFDHKTKVKARSEKQNFQTTSQLCTRHWGDKSNNRELTEGKCPKNNQNIFTRNLRRKEMFLVFTQENSCQIGSLRHVFILCH